MRPTSTLPRARGIARPALLAAACLLAAAAGLRGADNRFDFESLRFRAQLLAVQPYLPRPSRVPDWLLHLNYDQYRDIRFVPGRSWWLREGLPFQLQFFHPGFIFNRTVPIAEVEEGRAKPIPFEKRLFDYGQNQVGELPETMGFAGFRILYPLNKPGDELGAFQGASYFRFLCAKAVYGLSARGLAIDTAEPTPEEFPSFEEFWVDRPESDAKDITVYALLDGPSAAGAYRFVITPGADTVVAVHAVVYCRSNPKLLGLAPLTSMFWHGKNTNFESDDIRPEVHDSDGLMLNTGAGEWLWRPLNNPNSTTVAAFNDQNPRGFGLLQRERRFESYEDLEASYQLRPSAWVEPVGSWGPGSVRLIELHTPDETNDNIVACWVPAQLPQPGTALEFSYNLHWFIDQVHPPAGQVVATRHGRSRTFEPDLERFVVDFDGPALRKRGPDSSVQPVVSVGDGAVLVHTASVQKNPYNGSWRVAFAVRQYGADQPVELRCFLRDPKNVLTETWSYLWQP
jgi:periplasmic glucans biosynthesis protein